MVAVGFCFTCGCCVGLGLFRLGVGIGDGEIAVEMWSVGGSVVAAEDELGALEGCVLESDKPIHPFPNPIDRVERKYEVCTGQIHITYHTPSKPQATSYHYISTSP